MPSLTYMSDSTLLVSRLSLAWLTLCSLMAVMAAIPLIQGRGYEPTDPIFYAMLLGPAFGWAAYFRRRLRSAFLFSLPPAILGLIFVGAYFLPTVRP